MPIAQVIEDFLRIVLKQPSWVPLLAWHGLSGDDHIGEDDSDFAAMVNNLRCRQRESEIARELDPAHVQLVLVAAVMPPCWCRSSDGFTRESVDSDEFVDAYAMQFRKCVDRWRSHQGGLVATR